MNWANVVDPVESTPRAFVVPYKRIMTQSTPNPGSNSQLLPGWPTCEADERCTGIPVDGSSQCLAHLDPEQLDEVLSLLHPYADLDVRGTTMWPELLTRTLDAVRDDDGRPTLGDAEFTGAIFPGDAWFDGAIFTGDAWFPSATFDGEASFEEVHFTGDTKFSGATFNSEARFRSAIFTGVALFPKTAFNDDASFAEATFSSQARFSFAFFDKEVRFGRVAFDGYTLFDAVTFNGQARFSFAEFNDDAWFGNAIFEGEASFDEATFSGDQASFEEARFEEAEVFGLVAARTLTLARAVFSQRVVIQISAAELDCSETRFLAGAALRLRHVRAAFRRTVFSGPSAILDAVQSAPERVAIAERRLGLGQGPPAVTSLEGVDVTELVVTDIDLSPCRFAGAHHLDKLRLEGDCQFAWPPEATQRGWTWPPVWRWTRRQVLAEECDRRAAGPKSAGWPTASPPATPLNAKRVAALYRDLRKAQEDSKNEPGAADFYYGEMEMRRTDHAAPRPERSILFLYWLVSGYGLRMTRALGCLATLIATASVGLHVAGFATPRPSLSECLLYATESAVSLDSKLPGLSDLTWQGEVFRVIMRLLGPVLLGLALLAIRNRVKR